MDGETQGVLYLCGCCSLPFLAGFVLAWFIRGRLLTGGVRSFIPRFLQNLFED